MHAGVPDTATGQRAVVLVVDRGFNGIGRKEETLPEMASRRGSRPRDKGQSQSTCVLQRALNMLTFGYREFSAQHQGILKFGVLFVSSRVTCCPERFARCCLGNVDTEMGIALCTV